MDLKAHYVGGQLGDWIVDRRGTGAGASAY